MKFLITTICTLAFASIAHGADISITVAGGLVTYGTKTADYVASLEKPEVLVLVRVNGSSGYTIDRGGTVTHAVGDEAKQAIDGKSEWQKHESGFEELKREVSFKFFHHQLSAAKITGPKYLFEREILTKDQNDQTVAFYVLRDLGSDQSKHFPKHTFALPPPHKEQFSLIREHGRYLPVVSGTNGTVFIPVRGF